MCAILLKVSTVCVSAVHVDRKPRGKMDSVKPFGILVAFLFYVMKRTLKSMALMSK